MGPGGNARTSPTSKGAEHAALPATLDPLRPTSFFLANEEALQKSASPEPGIDSTFGVRSLQDTTANVADEALRKNFVDANDVDEADGESVRRRYTLKPRSPPQDYNLQALEAESLANIANSSPRKLLRRSSPPSASQSLASLSQASQDLGSSLSSSPKSISNRSFRPSDADSTDGASQAIASSEDEAETSPDMGESAPQLIMPSIKIPSRRPFTDRGKQIGRLKILTAGDSGVGKSSLIKSIVQMCEDIVHVDPLSPSSSYSEQSFPPKSRVKRDAVATSKTEHVTEVFASTKPYPLWWSEIEEHKIFRKYKSMGDAVLERNVCFVDTPGHGGESSAMELVLQYLEEQLSKTLSSACMAERDLVSMLSGDGGTQVDLVLYLVSQDIKPADLDFLHHLTAFTNVVPMIAKADLLSRGEVEASKAAMVEALEAAGIKTFNLNTDSISHPPYTVCSAPSKDEDTMDASLLMSPDYVQPLISSELSLVVQQIFDPENIPRLRHLAAAKLVRHQISASPSASPFNRLANPSFSPTSTASFATRSQTLTQCTNFPSSYLQAQIADHTLREERLAQARLARWATDLQRGLHNERARYEALARGDRAVWLTQRLSECTNDGLSASPEKGMVKWSSPQTKIGGREIDASDPLGLVNWGDVMRRRGWTILELVGGFGVLGAAAVWVARGSEWNMSDGGRWGWWAGSG